jgi:HEAT repeat protein
MFDIPRWTFVVLLAASSVAVAGDEDARSASQASLYDGRSAAEWAARLADGDLKSRQKAVYALWNLGPAADVVVAPLAKAIGDDDPYVRSTAARSILRLSPDAVTSVLPAIAAQLGDGRQDVRREAVRLLSRLGPLAAHVVPQLTAALTSSDPDVRRDAAASLGEAGEPAKAAYDALTKALLDSNLGVQQAAGKAVVALDPLTSLKSDRLEVRIAVLQAIDRNSRGSTNSDVVAAVLEMSKDPRDEIRTAAVKVLAGFAWADGDRRDVTWIPVFRRLLEKDPVGQIRLMAAIALSSYTGHGPDIVPVLVETAKRGDPELWRWVVAALANLKEEAKAAIPLILEGARSDDCQTRSTAIHALGPIGDASDEVVGAITGALRDQELDVRRRAIQSLWSLGRLGRGSARMATELVAALRRESDPETHALIAMALAAVGVAEEAVPTLTREFDADPDAPLTVAHALCALDAPCAAKALERLVSALEDPDLRDQALGLLKDLGPKAAAATAALTRLLAEPGIFVRAGAADALGAIGPSAKEALPALERAAQDKSPAVSDHARRAIASIRAPVEARNRPYVQPAW